MPSLITDKHVKTKLAAIAAPVVVTPKLFPYNCLPPKLDNYPGIFKYFTVDDPDTAKVHGWIISRNERMSKLRGGASGCQDYEWTYRFWGFYGIPADFSTDSNPDDDFNAVIDALCEEINKTPLLMVNNGVKDVMTTHDGLGFGLTTILRCGQERLLWAPGKITVKFST